MSELEDSFAHYWRLAGGTELERQFRFDPSRRWRADFAHVGSKVLIECEGGLWCGGRHVRGKGYAEDCKKYNVATKQGWRLFRVTRDMLDDDPLGLCESFMAVIEEVQR